MNILEFDPNVKLTPEERQVLARYKKLAMKHHVDSAILWQGRKGRLCNGHLKPFAAVLLALLKR